jgi:ketosteroid isomerase-like protein
MGAAELELVRRAYEVFDTDLDALLGLCAREIEWVSPDDTVESGPRRGHDGVRKAYESTAEAFVEPVHECVGDLEDGIEGRVLVPIVFHATGRGSGMELHKPEWHVWTVRDGKAVRFAWFNDEAPAREEAGLVPR